MIELGQLEKHHAEFEKRNVRLIVSSVEGREDAEQTQTSFPHLTIVSDESRSLSNAVDVMHRKTAPDGSDTSAPTTLIIDGAGIVRWTYRSGNVVSRLSPEELLTEVDKVTGRGR
jgi:alkyl hydroperoxide reductase subunit AhpC